MALQEHLGDACRDAEVAVDLEGRMGVEEVGIGAAVGIVAHVAVVGQQAQHVRDNLVGVVAVEHACPEAGLPTETPARGLVATLLQRHAGGLPQVGRREG